VLVDYSVTTDEEDEAAAAASELYGPAERPPSDGTRTEAAMTDANSIAQMQAQLATVTQQLALLQAHGQGNGLSVRARGTIEGEVR
jgi:hypothetical protein